MKNVPEVVKQARARSAPILVIETLDAAATRETLSELCSATWPDAPQVKWDCGQGFLALTAPGKKVALAAQTEEGDYFSVTNVVTALDKASKMEPGTILYMEGMDKLLALGGMEAAQIVQGIINLRDAFKNTKRTLLLMGTHFLLPPELDNIAIRVTETLPGESDLMDVVDSLIAQAQADLPDFPSLDTQSAKSAVDALKGLTKFGAEQTVALCLTSKSACGLNLERMWERKRDTINNTPGLSVFTGSESFQSIGGCGAIKFFLQQILQGPAKPGVILFMDEIEKTFSAGLSSDTSGVSQEMFGKTLTWMNDRRVNGIICLGPPGTAKSAVAKAAGNEGSVMTVEFDIAGMKGGIVGESGLNLRRALGVIDAISDKPPLIIATCNSVGTLPPELQRRFKLGRFFFPLPTSEERTAIWYIYCQKYELPLAQLSTVDDDGWTGAEIENCCYLAYVMGIPITEAAKFIVPVSVSLKESIEGLCRAASHRFLDASKRGYYVWGEEVSDSVLQKPRRSLSLEE